MPEDAAKIRKMLAKDVKFMQRHGIMDYSLLLSAEKYTHESIIADNGEKIGIETPKKINTKAEQEFFHTAINSGETLPQINIGR